MHEKKKMTQPECLNLGLGLYVTELSGSFAIGKLIQRYPDLRIHTHLYTWEKVSEQVRSGAVDLGLAEISDLMEDEELSVIPLVKHKLYFYCRSGHPLLTLDEVTKEEMDRYPVVGVELPARVMDIFPGKTFKDLEHNHLLPTILIENISAVRNVVAESDAFSIATLPQLESRLLAGQIGVLRFQRPWMVLNYGFIYRRDRELNPALQDYMELVREQEIELEARNQMLARELFGPEAS